MPMRVRLGQQHRFPNLAEHILGERKVFDSFIVGRVRKLGQIDQIPDHVQLFAKFVAQPSQIVYSFLWIVPHPARHQSARPHTYCDAQISSLMPQRLSCPNTTADRLKHDVWR